MEDESSNWNCKLLQISNSRKALTICWEKLVSQWAALLHPVLCIDAAANSRPGHCRLSEFCEKHVAKSSSPKKTNTAAATTKTITTTRGWRFSYCKWVKTWSSCWMEVVLHAAARSACRQRSWWTLFLSVNKTKQNKKQKINNTSSSSSSCIYRRTSIPLCILSTISPSHCTQESLLRPRTPTWYHPREGRSRKAQQRCREAAKNNYEEGEEEEEDDDDDMQVPACLFSVAVLSLCPDHRAGIIFSSTRPSPMMCFLHFTVICNMTNYQCGVVQFTGSSDLRAYMKEVLLFLCCCCCCCLNGRIESRPHTSLSSLSPLQLIHCNAKAGFDAVFGTFEMLRRRRRRERRKEGRKEGRWEGEGVGRPTHAHCQWASRVRRRWRPVRDHRHARNSNKCFFKSSPKAAFFFLSLFREFSPFGGILSQKLSTFYRNFLYFYFF